MTEAKTKKKSAKKPVAKKPAPKKASTKKTAVKKPVKKKAATKKSAAKKPVKKKTAAKPKSTNAKAPWKKTNPKKKSGSSKKLTRARHREALQSALDALNQSVEAPLPELAAEDLRISIRHLGSITGRVDVEDLLDMIFRDFCIGK